MIKKILAILMVLILSTIAAASAETMNKNQNMGELGIPTETRLVDLGNGMMRYDSVHHAKDSVSFGRFDAVTSWKPYDFKLMGVEWITAENFEVNLPDCNVNIIQTSLDTWDNEVDFNVFETATNNEYVVRNTDIYPNNINSVTFETYEAGGIAFARTWYNRFTNEIIESDVVFNSYYAWSTSGEVGKMDLQNIATHEFGHSAGLLDLYNARKSSENTMYGYSSLCETKKRILEPADIAGIHAIYGE